MSRSQSPENHAGPGGNQSPVRTACHPQGERNSADNSPVVVSLVQVPVLQLVFEERQGIPFVLGIPKSGASRPKRVSSAPPSTARPAAAARLPPSLAAAGPVG